MIFFMALAAAGIAAVLTPAFALAARRIHMVAQPRADRWGIREPVPLLGGAAIAFAFLIVFAPIAVGSRPLLVVAACGGLAFALGLLDDFRHVAPTTKLVGQVLVASLLVFGGVQVEIIAFPPLTYLLTVLWIVGMMNALNLMDNMDGLAAGISAIAAAALTVTALQVDPGAALVAATTAGAAVGFLVHNFAPARVFMGDAGSQLLGFLLAAAALLHTASGATNVGLALIGPLAVLALPIFDTTFVTVSRGLAGRPVSQGGRDHTSHRLAALGFTDRATVLFLYAIAALLAALGIVSEQFASFIVPLFGLAILALVLFGVLLHEVDVYGKRPAAERLSPDRATLLRELWVYARFGAEVCVDAALLTIAYYSSYLIRFEGIPEPAWLQLFVPSLPLVVAAQLAVLVILGVYRTLWRYLGVSEAIQIVRALVIGTAAATLAVIAVFRFAGYSRAVFVLDVLIACALIIGTRAFFLWLRHFFVSRPTVEASRVLIVGANDRGVFALRLLTRSMDASYRIVGFLDDDVGKRYRQIAGVPVVGQVSELEAAITRHRADLVVVAVADGDPATAAQVRAVCGRAGIECREFLVSV